MDNHRKHIFLGCRDANDNHIYFVCVLCCSPYSILPFSAVVAGCSLEGGCENKKGEIAIISPIATIVIISTPILPYLNDKWLLDSRMSDTLRNGRVTSECAQACCHEILRTTSLRHRRIAASHPTVGDCISSFPPTLP